MSDSINLKIADRDFTVRRLTLRQSRAIGIAVMGIVPAAEDGYGAAIDQAVGIITAALSRDFPDMTADALLNAEISGNDLVKISGAILEFGEYLKPADPAPTVS